jgi:hypothetical protein
MMELPTHRADRLIAKVSRKEIGDLTAYGLPQPAAPGLRFIGYDPRPAHLGYMAGEATRTAQAIAHELGGSPGRGPAATVRRSWPARRPRRRRRPAPHSGRLATTTSRESVVNGPPSRSPWQRASSKPARVSMASSSVAV